MRRAPTIDRGTFVSVWVDLKSVGCGWRTFLVLARGSKTARLLQTSSCRLVKIPTADLDGAVPQPRPAGLAQRIRERRRWRKAHDLPVSKVGVRAALVLLGRKKPSDPRVDPEGKRRAARRAVGERNPAIRTASTVAGATPAARSIQPDDVSRAGAP